jgi:hypothetical protein
MADWTVKEFAARERVDTRTVRRWIVKGAVPVRRTPGGGIRIVDPSRTGAATGSERTIADNRGQSSS